MMGRFFLPVLFALLLFRSSAIHGRTEAEAQNLFSTEKVTISILSKFLRLMKEERTGFINFSFPEGSVIDAQNIKSPVRGLKIIRNENSFIILADGTPVKSGRITINGTGSCRCSLADETRNYPLPLEILNDGNKINITVTETAKQYSVDSAYAETGFHKAQDMEAVKALSQIIYARIRSGKYRKHRDYDFCDLTCCQVYRGRSTLDFDDSFIISNPHEVPLYFHSSNGGRIMTESVFSRSPRQYRPPMEYSFNDRFIPGEATFEKWERSIRSDDLEKILNMHNGPMVSISFNLDREQVLISFPHKNVLIAPETFRLKINRKLGWNYIRSNYYTIEKAGDTFIFSGSGLGHCAGLSITGARNLSNAGYSSREILRHYFPIAAFTETRHGANAFSGYHVIFTLKKNGTLKVSGPSALMNRRIPCGSTFKIITSLYLAMYRPDILHRYSYNCTGKLKIDDSVLECWEKKGHGTVSFTDALASSCNLYFSSLGMEINQTKFLNFIDAIKKDYGINFTVRKRYSRAGFSRIMCGLDFDVKVTVSDLVKLTRLVHSLGRKENVNGVLHDLGENEISLIAGALHRTFTTGTVSEPVKKTGINTDELWGKTGTVLTGTNFHASYGIFIGGNHSTGIVALMPEGNGKNCAAMAVRFL